MAALNDWTTFSLALGNQSIHNPFDPIDDNDDCMEAVKDQHPSSANKSFNGSHFTQQSSPLFNAPDLPLSILPYVL